MLKTSLGKIFITRIRYIFIKPLLELLLRFLFCVVVGSLLYTKSFLYAQSSSITLLVVDEIGFQGVSSGTVKHTSHNTLVEIQANGQATIYAGVGDTLLINVMGYERKYWIYTADLAKNTDIKTVLLKRKQNILDTVEISPYQSYLNDSIENRKTYNKSFDKITPQPKFLLKDENATTFGVGASGLISSFAAKFNKKEKQLKYFKKQLELDEKNNFIGLRYSFTAVQKLTRLSDSLTFQFIAEHPMDYDFARNATDLEIKMWILYNFRNWKKSE